MNWVRFASTDCHEPVLSHKISKRESDAAERRWLYGVGFVLLAQEFFIESKVINKTKIWILKDNNNLVYFKTNWLQCMQL